MREGSYGEHPRATFMREAERAGALKRARARAASYAEAAAAALDALRPSEYADALRSIPSFILERET
jgi:geranylgeranyl pyrophosphate synthase